MILLLANCESKSNSRGSSTNGSSGSSATDQNAVKNQVANTAEFLNLAKQITDRRPSLNKEKDRRTRLMYGLIGNIGSGCMGDLTLTSLELIVDGAKIPDLDVTVLKQTAQYLPAVTAGETDFDFYIGNLSGVGFSFTNNELQNKLFGASIHYTVAIPKEKAIKLNSIDEIRIVKKLPAYAIKDYCTNGTTVVANCSQQRDIHEVERYQIKNLTIKANGKVFYTTNNINHIFSANKGTEDSKSLGLSWQDNNVQFNDAYMNLLQQKDCPSGS